MSTTIVQEPVVDEEIWRAWILRGRVREAATVRKMKLAAWIVVILAAFGGAFYRLASG